MRISYWIFFFLLISSLHGFATERVISAHTNTDNITNIVVQGDMVWCGTWEGGLAGYNKETGEWKVFTSIDGLANNTIQYLNTDIDGNLWATHADWGISYYDGVKWASFPSFGSACAWEICEDTNGQMWCSTSSGVYVLSDRNGYWKKLLLGGSYSITAGKGGSVWCAQNDVLYRHDGGVWTKYTNKETIIDINAVSSLLVDKNNVLWVHSGGAQIVSFDGNVWRKYIPSGVDLTMTQPSVLGPDGNIWIMSSGSIYRFNDEKQWELMFSRATIQTVFSQAGLAFPDDPIFDIDDNGTIWFADYDILNLQKHIPGLLRFDGNKAEMIQRNSMAFLRPTGITEDHSGNIWTIGTYGRGISRFDGMEWTSFSNIPGIPFYEFTGLTVDRNNNIWCSAQFGALRYDGSEWVLFNNMNSNLKFDSVNSIYLDSRDVLWFGADGAIQSYNGSEWKVYDMIDTGLSLIEKVYFCEDRSGALLIGGDSFLARFDGTEWKNIPLPISPEDRAFKIKCMTKAPNGDIWVLGDLYKPGQGYIEGTFLYKYNGVSWESFSAQGASTLAVDSRNTVWIGSNNKEGVSSFDGKTWTRFGHDAGINTPVVNTIFVDVKNIKWIGTEDGMLCIEDSKPTAINKYESIPSDMFNLSCYPNPFNSRVTILFTLPTDGKVKLTLFSENGQKVRTLEEKTFPAGTHSALWDCRDDSGRKVSSGVYIARLDTVAKSNMRKLLYIK